jgi:hypothetical protein
LSLIRSNPWTGVGWGEFNFAWTLTPFPGRPTAFFDHTHNLPLQLLVELGLPLGGLVLVLLAVALYQAFVRASRTEGATGVFARSAFVMVLLMTLHSQLEYPLWYAYFLLPTAFAWGYCLARPERIFRAHPARSRLLPIAGLLMIACGFGALSDYLTVSRIFEPGSDNRPLPERIADGRRATLFAHHADYAAATTPDDPSTAMDAFKRAPYYLLDARLMEAWAKALAAKGDLDKARHIAQRLREFRNPQSEEFFEPCRAGSPPQIMPFQCSPPARPVPWREFRQGG